MVNSLIHTKRSFIQLILTKIGAKREPTVNDPTLGTVVVVGNIARHKPGVCVDKALPHYVNCESLYSTAYNVHKFKMYMK